MRRTRLLLLIALAVLPVLGCTKGDECDRCTADTDCKDGFFCVTFSDESRRCGSGVGASTCRVR